MAHFRSRTLSTPLSSRAMNRVSLVLIVLVVVVVGGSVVALATWDMPAPSKTVEKVLPDERFPR